MQRGRGRGSSKGIVRGLAFTVDFFQMLTLLSKRRIISRDDDAKQTLVLALLVGTAAQPGHMRVQVVVCLGEAFQDRARIR